MKDVLRLKDCYIARARRLALHMTQNELGDRIGKSGAWVSLFERGKIDDQSMVPVIFNELASVSSKWTRDEILLLTIQTNMILVDIYKRYEKTVPKGLFEVLKNACEMYGGLEALKDGLR